MAASNDDSATLARPNPTGDHVDEVHNHKGKLHPNGNFSLSSDIKEACRDVKALRGTARIKLAHPI